MPRRPLPVLVDWLAYQVKLLHVETFIAKPPLADEMLFQNCLANQSVAKLPNGYPFIFGFIHFVSRLHIKGFVERREVHEWAVHTPLGR